MKFEIKFIMILLSTISNIDGNELQSWFMALKNLMRRLGKTKRLFSTFSQPIYQMFYKKKPKIFIEEPLESSHFATYVQRQIDLS